jgi:hypothetical protein
LGIWGIERFIGRLAIGELTIRTDESPNRQSPITNRSFNRQSPITQ